MKALELLAVAILCIPACFVAAHSNNTARPTFLIDEHGSNPWVQAAVDFGVDPTFALLVSDSGGGDAQMSLICGSNAWNDCVNNRYGPWQSDLAFCIDMYLCAYYECEQCDGIAQTICIGNAQYDLYNCYGIDLMSLMERWGVDHDTAVELLR